MELGILLILVMFFFGVGKLPQIGKALGGAIGSVRRGLSEGGDLDDFTLLEEPRGAQPATDTQARERVATR